MYSSARGLRKLVLAVAAFTVSLAANAATVVPFQAEITSLQAGIGSPFAIGQLINGSISLDTPGVDLASSNNNLSAYSGIATLSINIPGEGISALGEPGNPVTHPGSQSWTIDGLTSTLNSTGSDTLTINIGTRDAPGDNWGGIVNATPNPVGGKNLEGLSIDIIDRDGVMFDSLGQNPDPQQALFIYFANRGEFERGEVRLHFGPDLGPNSPTKITADLAPVPLPAGVWLLGSALLGLAAAARRRRGAALTH